VEADKSEPDSLDGLTLAAAFRRHVIEDGEIAAIGQRMLQMRRSHSGVFLEGEFPDPYFGFHWPLHASAKKIAFAFVNSPLTIVGVPSPEPSALETAAAELLANRIAALVDWLARGEIIAVGTFATTGVEGPIGSGQWTRTDLSMDVRDSAICETKSHPPVAIWTGVCLRLPDQGSSTDKAVVPHRDAESPTAARKQIQTKTRSRQECLDWLTSMMSDVAVIPLTNAELWAKASAKWPDKLSKREFDKCRAQVLDRLSEEQRYLWARPGPKPKSSQL